MNELIEEYLENGTCNENANTSFSISGLKAHIASGVLKETTLSQSPAAEYHRSGALHLHDLSGGIWSGYCRGMDLLQLLLEGIKNPAGTSSRPAKHFDVVVDHIVNSFYVSQNEWEGAQAYSNFDTLISPFVYYDNLEYDDVKQSIQRMVFNLSYPLRAAMQTPFTNISFDLTCPDHMKDEPAIIGGMPQERTYSEFQREMNMVNLACIEVMLEGDKDGNPHTFPIPTISITKDFNWDCEVTDKLFELTAKFGTPYFMNYCLVRETPIIKIGDNGRIIRTNLLTIKEGQQILTPEGFAMVTKRHDTVAERTICIKLRNGSQVTCTPEHMFPTDAGLKQADDIVLSDSIAISSDGYDGNGGTFDQGRFVGLYVAEGWTDDKTQIHFSNKDKEIITFFDDFARNSFCSWNNPNEREDGVVSLVVNSKSAIGFIRDFIFGSDSYTKRLNRIVFGMSREFRRGLVQGWMEGDGHIKTMIAGTSMSRDLLRDMRDVCSSIGVYTSLNLPIGNNQTIKKCGNLQILSLSYDFLGTRENGIVAPSRTLKMVNDEIYCRIESIDVVDKPKKVIDIQIDNNSKIFTLSNGILTHNCGSGLDPSSTRSMCCRLNLRLEDVVEASKGGLWNAGVGTGSLSVVTINMPQLGYLARKDVKDDGIPSKFLYQDMIKAFYKRLDVLLDAARKHNVWKREMIIEGFEMGLMPFTKSYMKDFDSFFSTIGDVGMNECCLNMFGRPIYECVDFVEPVLKHFHDYTQKLTKEYGYPWNFEETPCEGSSHSLAIKDKTNYPDIITQGGGDGIFYTNSSHIYVGDELSLGESLRVQEQFKKHYSGGTLAHIFCGESAPDPGAVKDLIKNICTNTSIPYMALTRAYAVCKKCGVISDLSGTCPACKSETTVWDRVTGFYRPVTAYNLGKKAEWESRQRFDITKSIK